MRDSFDPEWLSVQQVAQLANLCDKTVRRAISERRLRATQHMAHGVYRIHIEDYDAWMQGQPRRQVPERHITSRSA